MPPSLVCRDGLGRRGLVQWEAGGGRWEVGGTWPGRPRWMQVWSDPLRDDQSNSLFSSLSIHCKYPGGGNQARFHVGSWHLPASRAHSGHPVTLGKESSSYTMLH